MATGRGEQVPVDSDVDLHDPRQRRELRPHGWPVLGVISAGGALGTLARYGIGQIGGPLWSTFAANVIGCLLIGMLMVLVGKRWPGSGLIRPFFGVGILGGFTTFSTYVLDIRSAVADGSFAIGLLYLLGTLVAALTAVWLGMTVTRKFLA